MKQIMHQFHTRRTLLGIGATFIVGSLLPQWPSVAIAHDELPPRSVPIDKDDSIQSHSASIQLWPMPVLPDLWTVVQWVDGQEQWHDVEGWRGTLNRETYVSWRVRQSEFGTGPFRWVVYDEEDGNLLVISEHFQLPINDGEILKVEVELPESSE